MNELTEKIPALEKLESEYYGRYYRFLLQAGESTQAGREASAKLQLRMSEDGKSPSIFEQYMDLKTDVRILLTKKEMLIEIGRNLRKITD